MKSKTLKKKIMRWILISVLIPFVIVNVVWFLNYSSYDVYLDENFTRLSYSYNNIVDRTGPIIYGVKKPTYLSFTGNLYIVSDDDVISIIIWPSFMCKNAREIGLILQNDGAKYMVYVNNNMEYCSDKNALIPTSPEEEETVKHLLENLNEQIVELYRLAKARFVNCNLEI